MLKKQSFKGKCEAKLNLKELVITCPDQVDDKSVCLA